MCLGVIPFPCIYGLLAISVWRENISAMCVYYNRSPKTPIGPSDDGLGLEGLLPSRSKV